MTAPAATPFVYRSYDECVAARIPERVTAWRATLPSIPYWMEDMIFRAYRALADQDTYGHYYAGDRFHWEDDMNSWPEPDRQLVLEILEHLQDEDRALADAEKRADKKWGLHPLGWRWVPEHYRHSGWTLPQHRLPEHLGTLIVEEVWDENRTHVVFRAWGVVNYRYQTLLTETTPTTVENIPARLDELKAFLDPEALEVFLALQELEQADRRAARR